MPSIFPFIDNINFQETKNDLPLFKEIAWDFKNNKPLFVDGDFITLEGIEALKVWVYKALKTERFRYIIYSWNYGNELDTLIGKQYTQSYTTAEGLRYVKEAILVNPYINSVEILDSRFNNGMIFELRIKINTIYGEGEINID